MSAFLGIAATPGTATAPNAAPARRRKAKRKKTKLLSAADRNLVSKFSYGITPALAKQVRAQGGAAAWFERQLTPGKIKDAAADRMLAWWPSLTYSAPKIWARHIGKDEYGWQLMFSYQRWVLMRRIHSKRQVHEVMTEFWENHLNVPVSGDAVFTYRYSYGQAIRKNALGRFDRLLHEAIVHPAMLIYLDAAVSTAEHPNENLGRELLELHTVGRGNYDEDDVKNSARILTGWHVDIWDTWAATYQNEDHWRGAVQVMGFRDQNASADGRDLTRRYLTYLARHPATAQRIARKLCVKFVSDNPPQGLVDKLAKVYLANDTAITPVLRALVRSSAFARATGSKVRDPGEDIVATYRALGVKVAAPPRRIPDDHVVNVILWQTSELGARPLDWPQPNGSPIDNASWSSPSRLVASLDVHYGMSAGWWPTRGITYRKPVKWLPKQVTRSGKTKRMKRVRLSVLIDHLSRELLHRKATPQLMKACCESVGYPASTMVDEDHPLLRWNMQRLLSTFLDSPTHMAR
ncbi:DUF1800 domain-containing protein [Nocardioides sp.]|uniref:DUF1800 domain-containing protein n=1 Tax=Nocardioides sp. TaxID=35761 RepID=UPI003567981E